MVPSQRNFSIVCENGNIEEGESCVTGQNSKPCQRKLGKRMLDGMKSLLKKQQAAHAAEGATPADARPKRAGVGVSSETDDLDLGTVLQTLRVMLRALEGDLAISFIDNLVACSLSKTKVSWKRKAYQKTLEEFVRGRSPEISADVVVELLSITGPTKSGRRATPKESARVAPTSGPAWLSTMECQPSSAESVCTDGEQAPRGWSSQSSETQKSSSLFLSPVAQKAWTDEPHDIVTEKTPPVPSTRQTKSSSAASSSEMTSPQPCSGAVRRTPFLNSAEINKGIIRRSCHESERRAQEWTEPPTHNSEERRRRYQDRGCHNLMDASVFHRTGASQPAHGREGVSSMQFSAELHPDFDHFLAAELQQYHVDRVLRLRRSVRGGERQQGA